MKNKITKRQKLIYTLMTNESLNRDNVRVCEIEKECDIQKSEITKFLSSLDIKRVVYLDKLYYFKIKSWRLSLSKKDN